MVSVYEYMNSGWRELRSPHPLFSVPYYLKCRPDVAEARIEPLSHFMSCGWHELANPCVEFDTRFYLSQNPDLLGSDPLTHYLQHGWRSGLKPSRSFDSRKFLRLNPDVIDLGEDPLTYAVKYRREFFDQSEDDFDAGLALSPSPLVSVITANKNGARHLRDLFESLDAQTYRNFEVILVDDGSTDGSAALAKTLGAKLVVENHTSEGFAEANNIGLRHARGELIALINNDTRVDANWLEAMVSRIMTDDSIAAVAPKIRFWTKFIRLEMISDGRFGLRTDDLKNSLEYQKYFIAVGDHENDLIVSAPRAAEYVVVIHLPVQDQPYSLTFEGLKTLVQVKIGPMPRTIAPAGATTSASLLLTRSERVGAFFIINNAGSVEIEPFEPLDRGFGEPEVSGKYYVSEPVDLFCGCSVLIRRDALRGMDLFPRQFFAYYEDCELGRRLREGGHQIVYDPAAIVYHKHSSTTVEHSLFWRRYTLRNRILYKYRFDKDRRAAIIRDAEDYMNHLRHFYMSEPKSTTTERSLAQEIPKIRDEVRYIAGLIDSNSLVGRNARVGLFNPWWTTLGGGESHALTIAEELTKFGIVDLISTDDFDLEAVGAYFGRDTSKYRKRIVRSMTPGITREYDLFVNSAYQNEMPSLARFSLFLVSFPSRNPSPQFVQSYYFLANSGYTFSWMRHFWGGDKFQGEILSPTIPADIVLKDQSKLYEKEKIILSVGRFVTTGHTKSQLEIAEMFSGLEKRRPVIVGDWKLLLIGTANDIEYVDSIRKVAETANIEIITNATHEEVRKAYTRAAIYVHAAGLGRSDEEGPEFLEHFGMTVAQALGAGCIPIVYDAGGPGDIVRAARAGYTFKTLDELESRLSLLLSRNLDLQTQEEMRLSLQSSLTYQIVNLRHRLWEILDRLGISDALRQMSRCDEKQV